jgi:hypothetical protein
MEEEQKTRGIERHLQTVMAGIATVLLVWVGSSVSDSGKEIVRLQEQVAALSQRLESVAGLPDRVARLEVRISQLEGHR